MSAELPIASITARSEEAPIPIILPQLRMVMERLQKENDQLKDQLVQITKKNTKLKEESDLLMDIIWQREEKQTIGWRKKF